MKTRTSLALLNRRSYFHSSLRKTSSEVSCMTSFCSIPGRRTYMEDYFYISSNGSFAGVFDGHGGSQVSHYLKSKFYNHFNGLCKSVDLIDVCDIKECFLKSVVAVDMEILNKMTNYYCGSTAAMISLHRNTASNVLSYICCNVGDSRIVLSRLGKAIDLTTDHTPTLPSELDRIKKLGGSVTWCGKVDANKNPIPGKGCYRVGGELALARAFGMSVAIFPSLRSNTLLILLLFFRRCIYETFGYQFSRYSLDCRK